MNKEKFVMFTSFFQGIDSIRNEFSSYAALTNAANGFADYYEKSYKENIFGKIDDECIMINPDTGKVKITRSKNKTSLKYKAPELIKNTHIRDNTDSDNFTLAVLLFRLFFIDHPFEGSSDLSVAPFLTKKVCELLYGYEPVFVYSPSNNSNKPLSNLSPYLVSRWSKTPQPLKDAFTQTFTDGINDTKARLSPEQWKHIINKIMDTGVFIDGQLYLADPDNLSALPTECVIIEINSRKIVIADGGRLIVSYGEKTTPLCADIFVRDNQNILSFENITDDTWIIYRKDVTEEYIQPSEKACLTSGDSIDFGSEIGKML